MTDEYQSLQRRLEAARGALREASRFMLLDYVDELVAKHQTPPAPPMEADALRPYARKLRQALRSSLGLSRALRRTALRARTVGRLQREGYVVEKVIFHPLPGLPIPAHLYLPTSGSHPLPAILYASGHFVEHGILYPDTQKCCVGLARLGFAVLAYEAMGQGQRGPAWEEFRRIHLPRLLRSERVKQFLGQFADTGAGRGWLAWAWHCLEAEHGQLPPLLAGVSQLGLMVWESIRALDYLCTREEIDPRRLGMVGASGGGQNTYYTAAMDGRVQVAVSVCCLPSLRRQIALSRGTNWWGGDDLCDQVPKHMAYAEFADVAAAIVPRPLLFVVGRQDDGFPIDAARAEYHRMASFYGEVAPGRLQLTEVDGPHGLSQPMREATYGWFMRWLQGAGDGQSLAEPPNQIEPTTSVEMQCLPHDAAMSARRPLVALARRLAAQLERERAQVQKAVLEGPELVAQKLRLALGPPPVSRVSAERVAQIGDSGLIGELIVLRTASPVWMTATLVASPDSQADQPLVVIVHDGDWVGLWDGGVVQELTMRGCRTAILDVRGTGPEPLRTARPSDLQQALHEILLHRDDEGPFVTDFEISSAYLMLGRTLLSERVWDLRQFVAWALQSAHPPSSVRCLGVGQSGLVALCAAALETDFDAVATWHSPASFASLIVERPVAPMSSYPFGVLRHFDTPELAAAIAPRSLTIGHPCDGEGRTLSPDEVAQCYKLPRARYAALGVPDRFQVLTGAEVEAQVLLCDRLCATGAGAAHDPRRAPRSGPKP